jgi:cytochrome c biogenesis protein CcmG/thiol:disulfide interchange protein DsbE
MSRGALVAAILLGACIALGCGATGPARDATDRQSGPPTSAAPGEGRPAPNFSFTTFDGVTHTSADLKGSPVVLNFWAVYCPACGKFAPTLEKAYQAHKPQGLLVFGIAAGEPEHSLKEKAESLGLTYPLASSMETARSFGVRRIPMTFLIDADGNVQSSLLGARDLAELETELKKIL